MLEQKWKDQKDHPAHKDKMEQTQEAKKVKISTVLLIVFIALVFVFTAYNIFMKPFAKVEPVFEEKIIERTAVLIQGLTDKTGTEEHSKIYNIGEKVYVTLDFSGYALRQEPDYYFSAVRYKITVYDPSNNPVEGFDGVVIGESQVRKEEEFDYFNGMYVVPTINLDPGNYRIVTEMLDYVTMKTYTAESLIIVKEHDTLSIVGFDFGYFDSENNLFTPFNRELEKGASARFNFHLRGMKSIQNKLDIVVDLNIYDSQGNLLEDKSMNKFFVDNTQYEDNPVYLNVHGALKTYDLEPDTYTIELVATDNVAQTEAKASQELVII